MIRATSLLEGGGRQDDELTDAWRALRGHGTSCVSCAPLVEAVLRSSEPSPAAVMRCCTAGDALFQAWTRACRSFRAARPTPYLS